LLYSPVQPMHIPDGFLSTLVSVVLWGLSAIVVALALQRVGKDLGERQVPLMGVLAAAIFAGQMLNFSVTGGTSGHLLGAALATMAVIGVMVSYFVYSSIQKLAHRKSWGIFVGGAAAAWLSIVTASLACALELALSGTSPANIAIPAMGGIHMLIGLGEGLITIGALAFLYASRRDLFHAGEAAPKGSKAIWVGGLTIAAFLAVLSPLASSHPDGLEWVAEEKGFLEAARAPLYHIIPDYVLPGISNGILATIAAGILGVLLVFGVALGVAILRRKKGDAS
jgi:cobalt/nickel transport system permease protein